jgi:hypothetical protein
MALDRELASITMKWEEFVDYLSSCYLAKMDSAAESDRASS